MSPPPVVAAIDPATRDLAPARFAALIARTMDASLLLAGVRAGDDAIDRLEGGQSGEALPAVAGDALDDAVSRLHAEGIDSEPVDIAATSAARGLALAVEIGGAGLLVIGSARGGAPGAARLGTTGERLLDGTACAVAVVPAGWEPPETLNRVGVGFVDTVEGREALHAAHTLAKRAAGELRVLAVVQPRPWMGDPAEAADDLRTRAEQAAGEATSGLLGVRIDVDVAVGKPAAQLLELSGQVDVLVCGARGYGPQPAVLLGGVTRTVARACAAPFLVPARGVTSTLR